jgi:hypothetical protein
MLKFPDIHELYSELLQLIEQLHSNYVEEKKKEGTIFVDCHVHGNRGVWTDSLLHPNFRYLAKASIGNIARYAAGRCDGLIILDQNNPKASVEQAKQVEYMIHSGKIKGLKVVGYGAEFLTREGELAGIGVQEPIGLCDTLEEASFKIRSQGGLVLAEHPYADVAASIEGTPLGIGKEGLMRLNMVGKVDLVEVWNDYMSSLAIISERKMRDVKEMMKLGKEAGISEAAGTDPHTGKAGFAGKLIRPEDLDFDGVMKELKSGRGKIGLSYDGIHSLSYYLGSVLFHLQDMAPSIGRGEVKGALGLLKGF